MTTGTWFQSANAWLSLVAAICTILATIATFLSLRSQLKSVPSARQDQQRDPREAQQAGSRRSPVWRRYLPTFFWLIATLLSTSLFFLARDRNLHQNAMDEAERTLLLREQENGSGDIANPFRLAITPSRETLREGAHFGRPLHPESADSALLRDETQRYEQELRALLEGRVEDAIHLVQLASEDPSGPSYRERVLMARAYQAQSRLPEATDLSRPHFFGHTFHA